VRQISKAVILKEEGVVITGEYLCTGKYIEQNTTKVMIYVLLFHLFILDLI
jgi:hypothetical protein